MKLVAVLFALVVVSVVAGAPLVTPSSAPLPEFNLHRNLASLQSTENESDDFKINSIYPSMGPAGNTWMYLNGQGIESGMKARFLPDNITSGIAFYNAQQVGVTVPQNVTSTLTTVELFSPTTGKSAQAPTPFVVGVPSQPPIISNLRGTKGAVGCYNYVSGQNFVVGQTSLRVGNVIVPPVQYAFDQLGFSIPPEAAATPDAGTKGVTVYVTTPHGEAASPQPFIITNDPPSSGFC